MAKPTDTTVHWIQVRQYPWTASGWSAVPMGSGKGNFPAWMLLILICMLLLLAGGSALAQEFENRDSAYRDREPAYYAGLSLEYLDNKRDTEETGYYDLSQKQIQKEGNGSLKLYFLSLDGHYKAYDSEVRTGENRTSLSISRDTLSARAEFLDYIYLFAQGRNLDWRYRHVDSGAADFYEKESASAVLRGVGFMLGDWRMGLSPDTPFNWTYRVDVEAQPVINEDIEYKVNVWELVKKASNTQGPFYELGLKGWEDSSVKEGRSGSLQRTEGFVLLGIGFSENTVVYAGGKHSVGRIESRLQADDSRALRNSGHSKTMLGLRFGLGEESSIYVEQQFLDRKIEFENISYENSYRNREDKLTVGTRVNSRLSFELKFSKTVIDKSYLERVVNNRSYRYQQADNLIGVSVNMRFSE